MAAGLRTDVHLYPLYLKFAADQFQKGDEAEGLRFFACARGVPRSYECKVYEQMWEVFNKKSKMPPVQKEDHEYWKKVFHGFDGLSSTAQEKAMAIELFLQGEDGAELTRREGKVHECLWELHGRPRIDLEYGRHAFNGLHGRSASFEQKMTAARMYADRSRACTLTSSVCEMHLIKREDGKLELQSVYPEYADLKAINPGEEGLEDQIASFKKYSVMVMSNNAPIPSRFTDCPFFPRTYFLPGREELKLLRNQQGYLVWHMYDPVSKRMSCCNVTQDDLRTLDRLSRLPQNQWASVPLDFEVNVEVIEGKLQAASLSKISHECQMNPSRTVDRDNWAVTLISEGACCTGPFDISLDPGFGHAQIIYEGIKEGRYFVKYIHLTAVSPEEGITIPVGCGIVDEKIINVPRYDLKSPTWFIKSERAEQLAQEDKKIYHFDQSGNPFNPLLNSRSDSNLRTVISGVFDKSAQETRGFITRSGEVLARAGFNPIITGTVIFGLNLLKNGLDAAVHPNNWVEEFNCLTWAVHQLRKIGIPLPSPNPVDKLFSLPKGYIKSLIENPVIIAD